jgi:hypothetical protein
MLPSEPGDVFHHIRPRGNAFPVEFDESRFEIKRVPVNDCIDEQVQSGRLVELD